MRRMMVRLQAHDPPAHLHGRAVAPHFPQESRRPGQVGRGDGGTTQMAEDHVGRIDGPGVGIDAGQGQLPFDGQGDERRGPFQRIPGPMLIPQQVAGAPEDFP